MPDPDDRGEQLGAFGRWLARERELRGLAREEVGRAMKVTSGVVETLESGDAARMPPRAYAVGWLRGYAAAVGLDADEVVLRFEEACGGPAARAGGARPRAPSARVVVAVLAALAIAAAAAALLGS
jgi:cytoskeletal protein RodZ